MAASWPSTSPTALRTRPRRSLLRVCGARWQIEECFAQAKGEVGLDQYEVRTWDAWHRFVTLCLLAHAGLVVMRLAANQDPTATLRAGLACGDSWAARRGRKWAPETSNG
jgi:SRSO17 transposase